MLVLGGRPQPACPGRPDPMCPALRAVGTGRREEASARVWVGPAGGLHSLCAQNLLKDTAFP